MEQQKNNLKSRFSAIYMRITLLVLGDMLWAVTVFSLAMSAYWLMHARRFDLHPYWKLLPFVLIFVCCNSFFRCYHGRIFSPSITLNKIEEIRRLSLSVALSYLLLFAWLLFSRTTLRYSRAVLLISMIATVITLPMVRFCIRMVMKKLNIGQIGILIAGAGKTGKYVCKELDSSCYYGFRVAGFMDDSPELAGKTVCGHPVLGRLEAAGSIGAKYNIDHIICCIPPPVIEETIKRYSRKFRHMVFIPTNTILPVAWACSAAIGLCGGFEICNQRLLSSRQLLKRVLELTLSFAAIFFISPVLLVLAILVKLSSPGPVFYRAERLGLHGKPITVLKFRTMYIDADIQLEKMLESDPALKAEWQEKYKLKNDPRITPVGKFLRETSLDELPQFWNVLKGDMALIGPRPIVKDEVKYYGEHFEIFKQVKPGITGLWQVSGRSGTGYEYRVMLDMYYITNWTVWMDYYIFFKTLFAVIARDGAC